MHCYSEATCWTLFAVPPPGTVEPVSRTLFGKILWVWVGLGLASTYSSIAIVFPILNLVLPKLTLRFHGTYFGIA